MQIDIVNEQNEIIGVLERSKVLAQGKNFRTVHAWLFRPNGRLVLQELAPTHSRNPNLLGSSVAGYLHAGETYRHAIERKSLQEVGVIPRNLEEIGSAAMSDESSTKFVSLYIGYLDDEPKTEDLSIERFIALDFEDIDRRFKQSPESFTPTFGFLYREFRDSI